MAGLKVVRTAVPRAGLTAVLTAVQKAALRAVLKVVPLEHQRAGKTADLRVVLTAD
jgi:hypothetical protein